MSVPEKLGKYPITGVLGTGAMGVVYKALDPVIDRPVAIKTILKSLLGQDLSGSSAADRFRHEARAVGRLSHPGIVAIYEYGEDAETAYIAMEYVEGRSLAQVLAATPRLPEADILTLMDQLLAALDCAHRAGVWHRDIKPANLIVTDAGRLKLTDFGIARIETVALTQVNSSIGTPGYMAPEQYAGEGVDHRVDIFACGVLLYAMLCGHGPFRGSPETVMFKVLNEDPLPPSQVAGSGRSTFYDAVVARALAKRPADRYASVAAFRDALARRVADATAIDAEATRIVVRPGAAAAPAPVPASSADAAPSASGTRSATTPIAGWDEATLAQVELALASFIGPVARVLVRQAARSCADLNSLSTQVAGHLAHENDRQRVLTRIGPGSAVARASPAASPVPPASAPASTDGAAALAAPLVAAATAVLARHLGPIAAVVARKAAARNPSREAFFEQLALPLAGADRDRLLAELRRLA